MTLRGATYRANPAYVVRRLGDLDSQLQRRLGSAVAEPGLFGALVPRTPGDLTIKLIGHDTARLLGALTEAGPLPRAFAAEQGRALDAQLGDLVAAQVLQVECDGTFATGLRALAQIAPPPRPRPAERGVLGRLSIDAIDAVARLQLADPDVARRRLYEFNQVPAGTVSRGRWPAAGALRDRLEGVVRAALGAGAGGVYRRSGGADRELAWSAWVHDDFASRIDHGAAMHKLYVSPRPHCLEETLSLVVSEIVTHERPVAWKVGNDLHGVLRPDKLVVHCPSEAVLDDLAGRLGPILDGMPAQGVPFTAELDGVGLLSRGVDPPRVMWSTASTMADSWRVWVVDRLADALCQAGREGADPAAARSLALCRLDVAGVDTTRWTIAGARR